MRSIDFASLAGGADWAAAVRGGMTIMDASSVIPSEARDLLTRIGPPLRTCRAASQIPRCARDDGAGVHPLELIPCPEAELLVFSQARAVTAELVIALEDYVVDRLVGETEGGDPARQRVVPGDAGGHARLRVVALVPEKGVELLGRGGRERRQDVVGAFHVPARDPAPHLAAEGAVDLLRVSDAHVGHDAPEHEGTDIVASVSRDERDGVVEGARAKCGVLGRAAAVPEGAADAEPGPDPFEPPGERRVGKAGLL